MMIKRIIITAALAMASMSLLAQNEYDAFRYSMLSYGGTARSMGLNNAFGSVGADMTAVNINPAGLAFFRSSQIEFTPAFNYNGTNSSYFNDGMSSGKLNFHIGSIGWASSHTPKALDWNSSVFSISYTRTNNFNNRYAYSGKNVDRSSLLDFYTYELNANGGTKSDNIQDQFPFGPDLAYQNYLVNPIGASSTYDHILEGRDDIIQSKKVKTQGGMGEYAINWAGNFRNKLFVGAGIDVSSIRYESNIEYSEKSKSAYKDTGFVSFTRFDNLTTKGTGFNLKIGAIYRIGDHLRVGASFKSPTLYSMKDEWDAQIESSFKSKENNFASPKGKFSYALTTPFHATGSMSYFFGTHGFISVDYEYVNYTMMKLRGKTRWYGGSSSGYSFNYENDAIKSTFAPAGNIRVGGEWRIAPLYLRAGFQYQQAPYKNYTDEGLYRSSYSAGVGYRKDNFFIDLAYQYTQFDENSTLYAGAPGTLTVANDNSYILLTVGFTYNNDSD